MQTVLYVYESQNNNGWKWCAVQTDRRVGEVQRLAIEKEYPRIDSKPVAVSIGVTAMARLGIDLDRVEFCRPPYWAQPAREAWAGIVSTAVNEAATALTLEEMRQMSLSIGRLTQELRAAETELATTKTELAAARGLVRGLENDRDYWKQEAQENRALLNTLRGKVKALVGL